MLSLSPSTRIFVHALPTDMRNHAVTAIMPSRPIPTRRKPDSIAAGAIG